MIPQKRDSNLALACNTALAELQKALKAMTFYPEKHPLREEILNKAYQIIAGLANEGGLSLIVRRNGISFAEKDVSVDNNPMTMALAKELFAREVQQLTLLPDLSYEEFNDFLALLSMEPHSIISRGGLAEILNEKGIRSVIANEIDITTVFTRKMAGAPSEDAVSGGEGTQDTEESFAGESDRSESAGEEQLSDLTIEELISLMDAEEGDDRYRLISRLLPAKGEILKEGGEFDRLFLILPQLLKQNTDERKSAVKRHCALLVFQQLALGGMVEHLLDHLEDESFVQRDILFTMLNRLGGDVVDSVIRRIIAAEEQSAIKTLTAALVRIGAPAIPALARMLKDNNWQIARIAVIILGEMGIRETVSDLMHSAYHPESRVRMEAIRSLARIGGREATALLLDLLDDKNQGVRKQTIIWLGITRNEKALQKLLELVMKHDLSGKQHSLKKEALVALGRIGDRQALEPLCGLVRKRHLLTQERWEELKVIAIEAIGRLGGESSREFLEKMEARGGRIGRASCAALKSVERNAHSRVSNGLEEAGELQGGVYE